MLSLGETKQNDLIFDENEVTIVADKELLQKIGNVDIDFNGKGFYLSSSIPLTSMSANTCI